MCVHHTTVVRPHSVTSSGWCRSTSASSPTRFVKASVGGKALGREHPLQPRNPVDLQELPVGHLRVERGDLLVRHPRRVAVARDTPPLGQGLHACRLVRARANWRLVHGPSGCSAAEALIRLVAGDRRLRQGDREVGVQPAALDQEPGLGPLSRLPSTALWVRVSCGGSPPKLPFQIPPPRTAEGSPKGSSPPRPWRWHCCRARAFAPASAVRHLRVLRRSRPPPRQPLQRHGCERSRCHGSWPAPSPRARRHRRPRRLRRRSGRRCG